MKSTLTSEYLHIGLSIEECLRAADGQVIGDRVNPIFLDAKIEVRRLEDYADEHSERVMQAGLAIAQLFRNEDLALFVPSEALRMTYIPRVTIPHERIIGSNATSEYVEHYLALLPPAGIEVSFDGSFRHLDLSQQFA